jgi:ribosomal protein S3AE
MAQQKKKKKFFDVEIPIIKKTTQLQAFDIEQLEGRIIKYDLTRMLKGKSSILQAKVSVKDSKAAAYPQQIRLMPYFLKRMIRKNTNYIETSFSTESKDAVLRFKPFLITRRKVSRAVRKALRQKVEDELIIYSKNQTAEQIFEDILRNKLQKELSLKLKKIYPLSLCEIRVLKIEKIKIN